MPTEAERPALSPRGVALVCGVAVATVGAIVLVGWAVGSEPLKQLRPDWPTMKANTAVGFMACGVALALCARGRHRWAQVPAGLAVAIGALTLAQYLFEVDLGIDELLFRDVGSAAGTTAPGRLAILTATDFILMGLALATWRSPTLASMGATLLAGFLALLNLSFYFLGALPPIQGTRMAIHTAVAFIVLGTGILTGQPGPLSDLFVSRRASSRLARRLLGFTVALPLVLGWLAVTATRRGWLDVAQASAFALFFNMAVLLLVAGGLLLGLRREEDRREEQVRETERARAAAEESRLAAVASEQRAATLFRALPEGILITRPDGTVVDLNAGAERLWGMPRERFLDPSFRTSQLYADPADRARVVEHLLRGGSHQGLELRMKRGDGQVRVMRFNSEALELGGEKVFLAAGQDVTAMHEARAALAESEAQQRAVLDNATDAIVTGDGGATIVGWNRAAERIFGYAPAEAIGKPIAMLLPAEQWAEYQADIAAFLAGKPSRYVGRAREMVARRKDGRPVDIELALAVWTGSTGPMFTGVVRDITERLAAESAVQRARQRFQTVFQASPVAISLTKDDGTIVDANPAFLALTGYAREDLASLKAMHLYEAPDERRRLILDLRKGGAVHERELRWRRKDGTPITLLASLEFVDVGGATTILGLYQDITERQKLQEERERRIATEAELERLRRTDQFRSEFINSTAHELSTPLTPLALSASILSRGMPDAATYGKHVAAIQRSVDRLRHVIGDMVSAADLQARAIALDRQRLNLGRQVQAAVAAHLEAAHRANLTLEGPADTGLTVSADESRLQLVLGHLLGNAIKFTPALGKVWVTVRRDGDHARVEVHDTGAGLTARQAEGLWKPYGQAHDKGQRTDSGSGLGLYITKSIIDLHKGEVGMSSPGPGKGSTFWFSLPLAPGNVDPLFNRDRAEEPKKRARLSLDGDPDDVLQSGG